MRARQRGVALVEFALVLPTFLILLLLTSEIGRALYQYDVITKAVRDAARFLSVQTPPSTIPSAVTRQAANLIVYGTPTAGSSPLALGLTTQMVKNPTWQSAGTGPTFMTVTVTVAGCASSAPPCYKFVPMAKNWFGITLPDFNFADISATMRSPT